METLHYFKIPKKYTSKSSTNDRSPGSKICSACIEKAREPASRAAAARLCDYVGPGVPLLGSNNDLHYLLYCIRM